MSQLQENKMLQINDDDLLYRRFHYKSLWSDGSITNVAYMRPKSTTPDPEISVNLARLTTPTQTLEAVSKSLFGLGELKVGDVRKLGFRVRYDPMPDNDAHCIIEGAKTEEDCDRLAEITRVHTPPQRR